MFVVLDGVVEAMGHVACNTCPDQGNQRDRVDLEGMHDGDLRSLMLSLRSQEIRIPVIAQSIVWIAFNGSAILPVCRVPVALEVKLDIGQRGVSFCKIGIEFDGLDRRAACGRHGLRGGHNFIKGKEGERISEAGVRKGELSIFTNRCFKTLEGLAQPFLISLFPKVAALEIRFSRSSPFAALGEAKGNRRRNDLKPDARNNLVRQIPRHSGIAAVTVIDLGPNYSLRLER